MRNAITSTLLAAVLACGAGQYSPAARAAPTAGVGATITLSGASDGEQIAATVVNVVDPARPAFSFDRPDVGKRLVGVELRLFNAGRRSYSKSPDKTAFLVDKSGRSFAADFASISAGTPFPGTVNIGSGDTRLGYVVFEIPNSSAIKTFRFTVDRGAAGRAGEWSVAGAGAAPREDPADVVRSYFGAINNGDCRSAWDLGGKNLGESYDAFTATYCNTVREIATILSASEDTVRVRVDTEQTDQSERTYAGTFHVMDGEIISAELQRV